MNTRSHPPIRRRRPARLAVPLAAALTAITLALPGCGTLTPGALPLGTTIDQVRHGAIGPTAEFKLPNGNTRLEFASGSFGKQTWMLDFDPAGALVANTQVLTEQTFATIAPGMGAIDVQERIGRPSFVTPVGWQNRQVWNYRYWTGDCVVFQVSLSEFGQGKVVDTGTAWDPKCDGPNSKE